MSGSLAADNPDVLQFETTIEVLEGNSVELAETYFYPGGGGQPTDRGTIGGASVTDITDTGTTLRHVVDDPATLSEGATVSCQVDPAFRTYCRRAHTASHILFGAGRRLFTDLGYGGFDIDAEKVRVDLRTPSTIDDDALVALERLTNRTVWDDRPVSWETVPLETARSRDDVAFNTATEEGVMAGSDTVRLVEIKGWDAAACGGTHVYSTINVGPVTVLDRSNPGEGLTRVEFTVGPAAIRRRADERRAAMTAATALGAPLEELGEAVTDLQQRYDTVTTERDELRSTILDQELATLDGFDRDGTRWRVGTVDHGDANEVGDRLDSVSGEVIAVAGTDDTTFLVVASRGGPVATSLVEEVTDEFGGGGGGGPSFAQGGGMSADPEAVIDYLRNR